MKREWARRGSGKGTRVFNLCQLLAPLIHKLPLSGKSDSNCHEDGLIQNEYETEGH